ncbi:5'-methylthioadenosine/S-adenosylhomocysteine nucleosidase [Aestuariimicrobium sp. p3-SID1156]|uniref:5'-methylthioadenosine/S-adenosylhomocysteine nucleosidase n=1 Tax=Aestuariimicrobium sp. p3-SID1156 TaxID=2916038 RepID=UPI00223AB2F3|nr:5'-methylthioadenosine/S-adenosylhomocysteine nucleosidase [Aestuariimicrobium sp. p3-SID1156]MCT1459324.1 5'-methylthioadenosine/S-adenosylhomocysteine nucleosidase [Aestuariimicrobium sp. p3-SID1156]
MNLDPELDHSPLGTDAEPDDPRIPVQAVIIAAMAPEIEPFVERSEEQGEAFQVGGALMRTAALRDHDVVLVHSGIGTVNAASAAVAALHRYLPDWVISVGSAGGIRGKVGIGDVAVSTSLRYSTADAVGFGYDMGQIPGMPASFSSDAAARSAVQGAEGVVAGPFASGDVFVQGPLLDAVLANFPDVIAVDMESTAIAQVCHSYGVGFVSVRGISDLCGPAAAEEHEQRVGNVSERAADIVVALLDG